MGQYPGNQRGGGGFAVGAGDDNRLFAGGEKVMDGLGHGTVIEGPAR